MRECMSAVLGSTRRLAVCSSKVTISNLVEGEDQHLSCSDLYMCYRHISICAHTDEHAHKHAQTYHPNMHACDTQTQAYKTF